MLYRLGSLSDLAGLKQLGKQSYIEFSEVLSGEHWEKMFIFLDDEEVLKGLIERSTVFICEDQGQIVGMVFFVPSGQAEGRYKKEWSVIRYLGVNPSYRGKGVGRILTEKCINLAVEKGENYIALHTSEFMHKARKMYESMGFIKHEQFVHYGKNYWIYLLQLEEQ